MKHKYNVDSQWVYFTFPLILHQTLHWFFYLYRLATSPRHFTVKSNPSPINCSGKNKNLYKMHLHGGHGKNVVGNSIKQLWRVRVAALTQLGLFMTLPFWLCLFSDSKIAFASFNCVLASNNKGMTVNIQYAQNAPLSFLSLMCVFCASFDKRY